MPSTGESSDFFDIVIFKQNARTGLSKSLKLESDITCR